ncbi:MAG: 2-amino-4-hydroxy-6-hydroxymethyldihydropteridine diphosphokinase [Lachnospiraceae bacterium]|nr:2-amino-4-hydroxy-6-hydroxymethyldihydropteridine diphosphokinase [Lachnospiraceae bacterium]
MDEIRIEDLEVFAHHGVYPQETRDGQNFYVNAVLYAQIRAAGLTDDLTLSTNYGEVCHFIHGWMQNNTFLLIESVAERLAEALLLKFPLIRELDLEIRKPQAPIGLPFRSVSVKVHRGWHRVFLAMGSNLGNREQYIREGIKALEACPQVRVKQVSQLLVTKPYGGVEQEDFLNGAMEIETLWTPTELLEQLHVIEAAAQRKREIHWGPRTLDLDILFYDKKIVETADLQIPHVDMQNRYFVLKPLNELAPYFRHPVLGKTVSELLGQVDILAENGNTDR